MFCSRVCYERLLCLDDAIRNHCLKDFRCPGLQSSVCSGFVLFSPNRGTNLTLSCQWEVWQQTNTQQLSVGGVATDQHPAAVSGRCGNRPTPSCQWEVWQQTNTQQLSVGGVATDQHPAVSGRCGNRPTLSSCQWEVWQQTNTQQLSVGGVATTTQLSVGGVATNQHPAAVSGRCGNKPTPSNCQWVVWQQTVAITCSYTFPLMQLGDSVG